jgi:hypothetical protein
MKKMGKIITAILMVLFAGCADIFDPPEGEGSAAGIGQALLSIGPQGVRTIMPTDYQDVTYTYEFYAEGKETVSGAISSGTANVDLEPGTWTLLVQGLLDGTAILEARETDIVISPGKQTPVAVSLVGIPEGEPGSLDYTVTFPDTVLSGFLRVYQWDKDGLKTPQVDLLEGATSNEGTKTRTGVLSLPVGYYRVALDLVIAGTPGKVLSKTEIAHIYPGLTTQAAFTAEIEDFMSTPGTVDGSQSTLAAALGTISGLASGTDVVYVLPPGDESMASTRVSNAIGPVTVTIDGGGREVTLTYTGSLIVVGDNVTLVFRNITLKGRGLEGTNDVTLISVERGGTLELGTGAKITGNMNSPVSRGGGVLVIGGTFTMSGGKISDNSAPYATPYAGAGGVYVEEGTFTMSGGEISANTGGGVYVGGGTFIMSGGEISANTSSSYGGGGVLVRGGTFTMSSGEISDNSATYGGGVYVHGGTFTMSSGEISGNSATYSSSSSRGGGVYVEEGTFTMSDGEISANTAPNGGGVYVSGGTFTMSDGEISGNSNSGVSVGRGTFTMNDGKISDNTSTTTTSSSFSGGVTVGNGGNFTMNGGEISDNTSTAAGGGVYVGEGSFTMSGGEISGNSVTAAASSGGGVFVRDNGTFTMSGGARINVNNPVCLYYTSGSSSYPSITIGGDFSGPTGPVAQIELWMSNDTPWSTWLGLQVIKTNYSGNVAVLRNRFTLGNFIGRTGSSGSYTYPTWPITDTGYEIGSDGTLRAVTP